MRDICLFFFETGGEPCGPFAESAMKFGGSFFEFCSRTLGGALEEVLRDVIDDKVERAQRVENAVNVRLPTFGLAGIRHPIVESGLVGDWWERLALGRFD